jgi:predicted DNA-binding transcriptional regulator AlpA
MKPITADSLMSAAEAQFESPKYPQTHARKGPRRSSEVEPLLTADDVAKRLNVSTDWVWDHSSRKKPFLPVIRMGDGTLRYRQSGIEAFIDERERISSTGRRAS